MTSNAGPGPHFADHRSSAGSPVCSTTAVAATLCWHVCIPAALSGIVLEEGNAQLEGDWRVGRELIGYIGDGYRYLAPHSAGKATFRFRVPATGLYEVRISSVPHANRSTRTPVTVISSARPRTVRVNQRQNPPLNYGFQSVGVFPFEEGRIGSVIIANEDCDGYVHLDAVQILSVDRD